MPSEELVPAHPDESGSKPDWARAGLKLVPYIGDALDELVYGRVDDARWERLHRTLGELGEMMEARDILADQVLKEDFAQLLEVVAPAAGRTTSEEKRRLLRDLLLNAVQLADGAAEWESAHLAADLILGLEPPALAILAGLAHVRSHGDGKAQLRAAEGGNSAELVPIEPPGTAIRLNYKWLVVDQAYRKLSSAPARLVVAGGRRTDGIDATWLTDLGEFLIEWATAKPPEGA